MIHMKVVTSLKVSWATVVEKSTWSLGLYHTRPYSSTSRNSWLKSTSFITVLFPLINSILVYLLQKQLLINMECSRVHIYKQSTDSFICSSFFFFLVAANVIWDQFEHFLPINFSYSDFAHSNDVVIILTTAWGPLGSGSIQHSNKGVPAVTNATLNPNMQGITLWKEKKKTHHKILRKKKTISCNFTQLKFKMHSHNTETPLYSDFCLSGLTIPMWKVCSCM